MPPKNRPSLAAMLQGFFLWTMVGITLTADIKKARRRLKGIHRKQIPFAAHQAINDVLFEARTAEQTALKRAVDRPTPYTQRGILVQKSRSKRQLFGALFVPANRWKYMQYVVEGGQSSRSGFHAIPLNPSVMNKYGGLGRNRARSLARRKGHFVAESNGKVFIWRRQGRTGRITPIVKLQRTVRHQSRYDLWRAARKRIQARFVVMFERRLSKAIATAR